MTFASSIINCPFHKSYIPYFHYICSIAQRISKHNTKKREVIHTGTYIHFTEDQKQRAASVDLEEFLRRRGEKLIPSGREKRLASDHSITVRGSEWYDHAEEKGGGPVSFVQTYYGLNYPEAMTLLLGSEGIQVCPAAQEWEPEMPREFVLPEQSEDMRRVYGYLMKHRHIDKSIISHFARAGTLYEDTPYHNCVFIGRDESGKARHAHKRSTNSSGEAFRINVEGGDPRYTFHHIGTDGSLYVFEAPIDLLSFISMYQKNWSEHSYVACCGVSIQPVLKMLERLTEQGTVYLCLDNDEAGHKASQRMALQLEEQGVSSFRITPRLKDWNDDLVALSQWQEPITLRMG